MFVYASVVDLHLSPQLIKLIIISGLTIHVRQHLDNTYNNKDQPLYSS